jgi:hypothetical protein
MSPYSIELCPQQALNWSAPTTCGEYSFVMSPYSIELCPQQALNWSAPTTCGEYSFVSPLTV